MSHAGAPSVPRASALVLLIARVDGLCPLPCPICGGQFARQVFIKQDAGTRHIPERIGVQDEPPRMGAARVLAL